MFVSKVTKKILIGVASLALVCPLVLSSAQSAHVHASSVRTTAVKQENNGFTPAQQVNILLSDPIIRNTNFGRSYLNRHKDLVKQEKLSRRFTAKFGATRKINAPFKVMGATKANHSAAYWYKTHIVTVTPKNGIKIEEVKVGNPNSQNKVINTKTLKQGTKIHVIADNGNGWVINPKANPNVRYYWGYNLGL